MSNTLHVPTLHAPRAMPPAYDLVRRWVDDYVERGAQFRDGEALEVGWMTFRVGVDSRGVRMCAPRPGQSPMVFVDDCSEALDLIAAQRYLVDSFGIESSPCQCAQVAIVVRDLDQHADWFLDRMTGEEGQASGWYFGARSSTLDVNDAANLEYRSLWELFCRRPEIGPFLELPPGWQVSLGERPVVHRDREPATPLSGSYYARKYGA